MSKSNLSPALEAALREELSEGQLSTQMIDRIAYGRDQWPRSLLQFRQGELGASLPDAVAWPDSPEQAAAVLELCTRHQASLTATGAGSAVTGAAQPLRKGVVLDLKRLNRIRSINPSDGIAEIEAGIIGTHLEDALNRAGWTLGHFPSSIMCSTLGGWVAARSGGQASSRYGKIEDLVVDLELACPDGSVRWVRDELDLTPLVVGSEGRFGVITACVVRIRPQPKVRAFRGLLFPTVLSGLQGIRAMMQSGDPAPAILRLYDPFDTAISSHKNAHEDPTQPRQLTGKRESLPIASAATPARPLTPVDRLAKGVKKSLLQLLQPLGQGALKRASTSMSVLQAVMPKEALLILGCEGEDEEDTQALLRRHLQRCLDAGGRDLGEGPGWHWFDHRYKVSFKQSTVFLNGAFADTMEVSASWRDLETLYRDVRSSIGQSAVVMAHFSHAYPEGCSIYFSFAAYAPQGRELDRYDRIWREGLQAAADAGASVSHHHGVGCNKAQAMAREWGEEGLELMRHLRQAFDPSGKLNPGKLDLDQEPPPRTQPPPEPSPNPIARLREQLSHLPWSTPEERLHLCQWFDLRQLLKSAQPLGVPVSTSPHPPGGLEVCLELPQQHPPLLKLDETSMLVTCDSRFPMEAVESYVRMYGFSTGFRTGTGLRILDWIERGFPYCNDLLSGKSPAQIYGLQAILPGGRELGFGKGPRAAAGPDLLGLFWQTQGAFGVVTQVTLRLRKVRPGLKTWRTRHQDPAEAIALLASLFRSGEFPDDGFVQFSTHSSEAELIVRFSPERTPGIVRRYHAIPQFQELSAFPNLTFPSHIWSLAASTNWSDLPALLQDLQELAPWNIAHLQLAHACHEGGVFLVEMAPSAPREAPIQELFAMADALRRRPSTRVWLPGVQAPLTDSANTRLLQRLKRLTDPTGQLNPQAFAGVSDA